MRRDHVRGSGVDARESRADEALAADRIDTTRLEYEVLVKRKVDELIEREYLPVDVSASQGDPDTMAVEF